jgi:hypothetical protein
LLECLKSIKVPSGYSSNISKKVSMNDLKLIGMKSHDCHVQRRSVRNGVGVLFLLLVDCGLFLPSSSETISEEWCKRWSVVLVSKGREHLRESQRSERTNEEEKRRRENKRPSGREARAERSGAKRWVQRDMQDKDNREDERMKR